MPGLFPIINYTIWMLKKKLRSGDKVGNNLGQASKDSRNNKKISWFFIRKVLL
jgi:hypothetical protein